MHFAAGIGRLDAVGDGMGHRLEAVVAALVAGDEEDAVAASVNTGLAAYPSSKRALARWVRRNAPTSGWAGAGIGLNAVAPGVVETAMTAPLLVDPAMVELIEAAVPMPHGGIAQPGHVADLIAYLTSPNSARICGQVVFVDGGADVVLRYTTAYPFGISLTRGYPRFNPGEYSTIDLLVRGDVDATLVLGAATIPIGVWLFADAPSDDRIRSAAHARLGVGPSGLTVSGAF